GGPLPMLREIRLLTSDRQRRPIGDGRRILLSIVHSRVKYFLMSEPKSFTKNPTPRDWPRISASVFYKDAGKAIDWLGEVFGFEVRLKVEGEGGTIVHSELSFGADGMIMVGSETRPDKPDMNFQRSPLSVGGANTQALMAFVDDADAHCAHAREHGASITM